MKAAIENHIRDVDAVYRPLIAQHAGRVSGGERLLAQFDQAVEAFRRYGRRQVSGVIERVNELAVARQLLLEPALAAALIAYEPEIVAGPKFDFVIRSPGRPTRYVEVKTVSPQTALSDTSWRKPKYEARRVVLDALTPGAKPPPRNAPPPAVTAAFLRYAIETQCKLAAHCAVDPGGGALIFCGDGLSWDATAVDDFATVYRGTHVQFAVMIRPQEAIEPAIWICRHLNTA
ncbi:MAG: hypothetical protein ABL901_01195 [Hyphomicrobiaceae bacterium]